MNADVSPLASVLSRSPNFHLDRVTPLAGRCRGTLIHCTFDAHTVEIPSMDEAVLLAANAYQLKRALFDFGWGFRDHFSSHPHPLHVFPPGSAYRWCKDGSADVTLLALSAADLGELLDELGYRNLQDGLWKLSQRGFANPMIYQALTQLMQQASLPCPQLLVDSYCTVIASELAQQWNARLPPAPAVRKLPTAVLARLIDHIKEHLAQDLSLDELAALTGFTKYHFMRCFKASTGRSPLQYVTELRIAHARRLLETSRLPMDMVARQSGFSSAGHLARVFGKATGLPPRAYRAAASVPNSGTTHRH